MKMRILTAILFSSVIFLFGPLVTYVHNHRSLSISFQYVLLYGILLFVAGALVVFLLLCLFRGKSLSIVCALIMGISFYLWFNGSFVDWNLGVLDGSPIDWDALMARGKIELALLVLFLTFAMLYHGKIIAKANKICAFLLLVQFFNLSYLLITTPSARVIGDTRIPHPAAIAAHSFSFSAQQNVIVIVLDSFANDVFDLIATMDNDIDIDHIFRDFTYFRNTTAGFPNTMPTIPMLLHGRMYSNEDGPFSAFQNRIMNENSLPLLLQNNGFDIVMSAQFENFKPVLREDYVIPVKYWWSMFKADVFLTSLIRGAPLLIKNFLLEEVFFMDVLHRWMYNDIKYFYNFINTANSNNPSPAFRFHHLWGIHAPYSLTRYITLRRSNNSGNAMIEQGIGYLKMVEKFLEKLRTIGVYDNSIIVILADHGKNRHYMSLPLLLIKPINATGEKMSVSLAPAALSDVPRTIAESLQLQNNLPGVDVFSLEESDQRVRYFYYYPWIPAYMQNDMLPPITKIRIPPLSIERERIIYFSLSDFSAPFYFNIESSSQLQFRMIALLGGFHVPEATHQWTGENSYIVIINDTPIDSSRIALIHIQGRSLTQTHPTKIFWNDKIIGDISSGQWEESTFIISAANIEPRNTLRFYTPNALSPRSLWSSSVDPRVLGFALSRISINFAEFPTPVKFGSYGNDSNFIMSGFSGPESGFRWTDGNKAVLRFWAHDVPDNLTASFDLFPLLREGVLNAQRVEVFVNDNKVADWELTGPTVKEIALPRSLAQNHQFEITFLLPDAASPKDLGINDDPRKLAVAFRSIQFSEKQ